MDQILIVEDHEKIRVGLIFQIRDLGFEAIGLRSAEEADAYLSDAAHAAPRIMLLDVRLGIMSGVDLIKKLSAEKRLPATIVISGEASISETVDAMRYGVYDFIEKPVSKERLTRSITNCIEHQNLKRRLRDLESRLERDDEMFGRSPGLIRLKEQIAKVAPTDATVLIRGESGTGKELVANMIHRNSPRRDRPFVKINCAAIPENLIEGELFGHMRGAFTDARIEKKGLFEVAHGGTLFLDEIGDMEPGLQSRLLRVLEDGRVRRLGDTRDREVDVRIVSATNRPIEQWIRQERFREDLYFRISTLPLTIPPLRERGEDIALLFTYYLDRFARKNGLAPKAVDQGVWAALERYSWPGNVRELKNLCERLAILAGNPILCGDLPSDLLTGGSAGGSAIETGILPLALAGKLLPLRDFKAHCEKEYIETVLRKTNWNFHRAAALLEIQRTYLYQKASSLGIAKPDPC